MNTSLPYSVSSAVAFVAKQGVVLASAKGVVPRLIDVIAGVAIVGNWWIHPRAKEIYNILSKVQQEPDILVCRLVNDKITLVHRRLWPALVRLAEDLAVRQTSKRMEQHSEAGHHVSSEIPLQAWVNPEIQYAAQLLTSDEARGLLNIPLWPGLTRPQKNLGSALVLGALKP